MQNSHFTVPAISVNFLSERKSTGEQPENRCMTYQLQTTKSIFLSGGNTMALALGIVTVSGIITYELEKNAPDVLGK